MELILSAPEHQWLCEALDALQKRLCTAILVKYGSAPRTKTMLIERLHGICTSIEIIPDRVHTIDNDTIHTISQLLELAAELEVPESEPEIADIAPIISQIQTLSVSFVKVTPI